MISIHEGGLGVGWTRFTRAFGDFSDGGFENFQLGIGGADGDGSFLDADHDPHNAAAGHDFVATPDGFHHRIMLLGLPLLGPDKYEIKNENHQKQREELDIPRRTPTRLLTRLRPHGEKCVGKAHIHKLSIIKPVNVGC